jgi:hypothetical protein
MVESNNTETKSSGTTRQYRTKETKKVSPKKKKRYFSPDTGKTYEADTITNAISNAKKDLKKAGN